MKRHSQGQIKQDETLKNKSETDIKTSINGLVEELTRSFSILADLVPDFLLHKKEKNDEEIERNFLIISTLLGKFKMIDAEAEQYRYFKYNYHTKRALYLRAIRNPLDADEHEQSAKNYESSPKVVLPILHNDEYKSEVDEKFFISASAVSVSSDESNNQKSPTKSIEQMLADVGEVLRNDIMVEHMKNTFADMDEYDPKTAIDFIGSHGCKPCPISPFLDEADSELALKKNKISKIKFDDIADSIRLLRETSKNKAYNIKIKFIQNVIASPRAEQLLYGDVVPTREYISKRFMELSLISHPDKMLKKQYKNLRKEDEEAARKFFEEAVKCRNKLLSDLTLKDCSTTGEFDYYQNKADDFWKIGCDFRLAAKGEVDNLKLLKMIDLIGFSSEVLKEQGQHYIRLAYAYYRACCKIVDEASRTEEDGPVTYLKQQVSLRENMALCMHTLNQPLVAQLYALGAIKLIFNHYTLSVRLAIDLNEAKQIYDRVRGISSAVNSEGISQNSTSYADKISAMIVKITSQSLVIDRYQNVGRGEDLIKQELATLSGGLMLKSDDRLVKCEASKEEILKTEENGRSHKLRGIASGLGAVGVGGALSLSAGLEIVQGVGLGIIFGTPILAISGGVAGLATIGLGVYAGKSLWNEGNHMLEEPPIRKKLNEIMVDAINYFNDKKYQEFIETLSQEYTTGEKLISLDDQQPIIPSKIVDSLLLHDFRPDGIAYLLNLIGEAFASGKVRLMLRSMVDLVADAQSAVTEVVYNKKLVESANKFDQRITGMRSETLGGQVRASWSSIKDMISIKSYSHIAKEYIDAAQEMPFKFRLEEMINVARINLACIRIIRDREDEFVIVRSLIHQVKDSIDNNYQFTSIDSTNTIANIRLEALEDFLWVVTGETIKPKEVMNIPVFPAIATNLQDNEDYIAYLDNLIKKTESIPEKVKAYNDRADYYKTIANQLEKDDYLASLKYWEAAKKDHIEALKLKPNEPQAAIGFGRCLSKLSKHTEVITFLYQNRQLGVVADYWILGSIAFLKKNNYILARQWILEALRISPKNAEAGQLLKLIDILLIKTEEKLKAYKDNDLSKCRYADEDYFNTRHANEVPVYKILSIDGGGIRGILPAMWLSEVEFRAKRPIAHLFNMAAGTSTGGIIAAGVSAPGIEMVKEERRDFLRGTYFASVPKFSTSKPRYSASDILQIYNVKAKEIFTKTIPSKIIPLFNLVSAKYSAQGRSMLFSQYFGDTRLKDSLIELVIPAVNNSSPRTHYFTRSDSRALVVDKNESYVNALMATSAAPTFFPDHKIDNKGVFCDGGVHVNNPTRVAYDLAKAKVRDENMFVLSMGTGSYMPDPLQPNAHNGLLFWAGNLHKITFAAQEGDTDGGMRHLGKRYQRWQAMMDTPIPLDAYGDKDIKTLLEMARQFMEENSDKMNSLLEFLDLENDKVSYGYSSPSI